MSWRKYELYVKFEYASDEVSVQAHKSGTTDAKKRERTYKEQRKPSYFRLIIPEVEVHET